MAETRANPSPAAVQAAPLWQLLMQAARMVAGVRGGHSLRRLWPQVPAPLRAGTQALGFEALRHLGTVTALREQLAQRAPKASVDAALLVALTLLLPGSRAGYADFVVVDQACEAVRRAGAARGTVAFVNACLRRFLRERTALLQVAQATPVGRWNHPSWWLCRLQADHPKKWQDVLALAQQPATMDLRLRTDRIALEDYLALLARAGIAAQAVAPTAVQLAGSMPVHALPGHREGWISVQSLAAQLAAPLLLPTPARAQGGAGLRILDACAAPGGKTAHLLELAPQAQVLALDRDAKRTPRITQTLQRLQLTATVHTADAAQVDAWWDGQPFDAILLDAPCSASGIAGRHPDVRWLRRASDIAPLAAQQDRLLHALWPLLAPGGRLLYCTCSVFHEEGEQRMQHFMAAQADAQRLPAPGHLLPGDSMPGGTAPLGDGFFYALVQKQSAPGRRSNLGSP